MLRRAWHRAIRGDGVLAACLVAFAGLLYMEALKVPPPFFDPLGSAAVPKFVALVLALLAVLLMLPRAKTPPTPAEDDDIAEDDTAAVPPAPVTAIASGLTAVAYIGLMQAGMLNFAQASTVFVLVLGALLARRRRPILLALVPVAFAVGYGFDYLFTEVLFIDLPYRSVFTPADEHG
ncbi:MAG: tripartite tricarboxylate transporter TctB family protein [Inquilinaceae bacterium]